MLRIQEWTGGIRGTLYALYDKFSKCGLISHAIEEVVAVQLGHDPHHMADLLGLLQLHRPLEQDLFFLCHIVKAPLQPVMLQFCNVEAVQLVKEGSVLI
nr:hypothetical protein [Ruthenibacterium lactatiformans]